MRWRDPGTHDRHHCRRSTHARQEAAISQVTVKEPNYFPMTLQDISGRQQTEVMVKMAQEHFEDIF
jgi:hypothetical protein